MLNFINPAHKNQGLSLLEMLVVIAIVVILASITIPSMAEWLQDQKANLIMKQLYTVINYARTEAVKRARKVIVCPTQDQETCVKTRDWAIGYMVIVAENDKEVKQEDILRIYPAVSGRLQWKKFGSQDISYLVFLPEGVLNTQNGTFRYCSSIANSTRKAVTLIMTKMGRARYAMAGDKVYYC